MLSKVNVSSQVKTVVVPQQTVWSGLAYKTTDKRYIYVCMYVYHFCSHSWKQLQRVYQKK